MVILEMIVNHIFYLTALICSTLAVQYLVLRYTGNKKCIVRCVETSGTKPIRRPPHAELYAESFMHTFMAPFDHEDIFAAIMEPTLSLGIGFPSAEVALLEVGHDMNCPVSVGCIRKISFAKPLEGFVVSELVEVQAPTYFRWKLRESDATFNLVTKRRDRTINPECTIELLPAKRGTQVTLAYYFDHIQVRGQGVWCLLKPFMPLLLKGWVYKSAAPTWVNSMLKKGYVAVDTDRSDSCGSAVVPGARAHRSAQQRIQDVEEERRIKGLARHMSKDVEEEMRIKALALKKV